jgi:hypothetical protein
MKSVQQRQDLKEYNEETESKTQFGIPIDYTFSQPATEEQIQRTVSSLGKRGFSVDIVDSPEDARFLVKKMLPFDKTIFTATSETVRLSGLDQDINGPETPYKSIRRELDKLDVRTQFRERVKLGAVPDVVLGSVHAITEDGQVLVASASGSQLGPYAATAEKVIWLVGSQKIVPDLNTGFRRLQMFSYPLEDVRAREKYNMPSFLGKILIFNEERPGRINIVIIRKPIGF